MKVVVEFAFEVDEENPRYPKLHAARDEFLRAYVQHVVRQNNKNILKTADALGVNRTGFYQVLRRLGIATRRRAYGGHGNQQWRELADTGTCEIREVRYSGR